MPVQRTFIITVCYSEVPPAPGRACQSRKGGCRSHRWHLGRLLAANLTAPYDATTQGDTERSRNRFITAVYGEVPGLPPIVDGRRTMPPRR